jgi:hypothetical protein
MLWNKNPKMIEWINNGFDHGQHLKLRGLEHHPLKHSFGCADLDEAVRRQNLIRLLVNHADLCTFASTRHFGTEVAEIPSSGQACVNYFNPNTRNRFWAQVEEFIEIIEGIKESTPSALTENQDLIKFADAVKKEMKRTEKVEAQMGAHVVTELLKSTSIDGAVTVRLSKHSNDSESMGWSFTLVSHKVTGYRLYSLNQPDYGVHIDDCWDNRFWRKLGVYDFMYDRACKKRDARMRSWATPIIMTECPREVIRDVCSYLNELVRKGFEKNFPLPEDWHIIDLVVRFSYKAEGLRIKIVGLSNEQEVPASYEALWKTTMPIDVAKVYNYSRGVLENVRMLGDETRRHSYITQLLTDFYPKLHKWLDKQVPGLHSDEGVVIPSTSTDPYFKWQHVKGLCMTEEWRDTYLTAVANREYVMDHMQTLGHIADIAQKFVSSAVQWQLPFSFPELTNGAEANLSFQELWPVDLIGRHTSGSKGREIQASDLKPITALGNVSSGISMITGGNGAGKTTTGEELLGALYDAGSGFPVFGKGVRLNLRTVVGSIYLERGDGSTMQLSLVKLAKVLKEVKKHPQNGTFVFWDEAGTGTSASQGVRLGMAALARLKEIGCTVLVNTQIPALAEDAQKLLGARCFQVDMGHGFRPGIGEPDITELAKLMDVEDELGLNE